MPIDIQCNQCKKRFRVPDKFGGRRIKCPNCEDAIEVRGEDAAEEGSGKAAADEKPAVGSGAGSTPAIAEKPAPADSSVRTVREPDQEAEAEAEAEDEGQWYMQTDDGEQYGPVDREELNAWVAEGRIDGTCQLLCDGWDQWKWADELFPELAEEGSTEDHPIMVRGDSGKAMAPVLAGRSAPRLKARAAAAPAGGLEGTLAQTRPWVLLMAFLWFAVAGLGAMGGLVMLVVSLATLSVPTILVALVVLASYGLVGWPAYHLLVYAQRIATYVARSGTAELEQAMAAQRSFWRAAGIMALAAIGAWLLMGLLLLILIVALGMSMAA